MAILSVTEYMQNTGQSFTGDDLGALSASVAAAEAAVKRVIAPFVAEPTTYTSKVLDAPIGHRLYLPNVPVRSITSVYLRYGANGDSSLFTSDYLLTNYTDYYLPLDDPDRGYSRSGIVYRRGSSSWGYELRRPVGRLDYDADPNRGAILITYVAGPTSVPEDIKAAVMLAASLEYARRKTGLPVTSESWNGYSYSTPGPFGVAAISSPDVMALLAPYVSTKFSVG